jgi:hypothetical protein
MAAWGKLTAEGYFRHVSKPAILNAAKTFAPSDVNRLAKLKKGDLATETERLASDTGWMPAAFGRCPASADKREDAGDAEYEDEDFGPDTHDDTGSDDVAYADAPEKLPPQSIAAWSMQHARPSTMSAGTPSSSIIMRQPRILPFSLSTTQMPRIKHPGNKRLDCRIGLSGVSGILAFHNHFLT